jgi:hypothetical protein
MLSDAARMSISGGNAMSGVVLVSIAYLSVVDASPVVSPGHCCVACGPGAALPPLGGVGMQQALRWGAVWLAFVAALVEAVQSVREAIRVGWEPSKGKGAASDTR